MLRRVEEAMEQIGAAETLRELPNVTKLSGASAFYRLRVGHYPIGIAVGGEQVEFVRCLHRQDI